jgi:nucleoside-diphosphate-sugar epimerase
MEKNTVVIGATGIVGSHVLLQLLLQLPRVTATKQSSSDVKKVKRLFTHYGYSAEELFSRIDWRDMDLRDIFSVEEAIDGADTVYHCAGFVSFNSMNRKQLMEVNVEGTKNIVNACLYKGVRRFCYVSSLAAMHNLDIKHKINESVFWKSSGKESDYAVSKYKAELEVWRGMEEGLLTVVVSPGVVLSPVFWQQSSSRIFDTCYKGNAFYPPGTTGYVSARDVAACMCLLMEKQCYGQRYVLVEGNYGYKEIFSLIQKQFNRRAPFIPVNKTLMQLARMADTLVAFVSDRPANITKAIIRSAFNMQEYDNNKITQTLGFRFEPCEQTIADICKAYLIEKGRL